MEWIVIYWLAASPDAPPHYLADTYFGSQEYCEEWAAEQDDWSRFQCAVADGGSVVSDLDSISSWAIVSQTDFRFAICADGWHPPLLCP